MKVNEIQIGDWVQNPLGWRAQVRGIRRIQAITDEFEWRVKIGLNDDTFTDLSLGEIEPIPLTEEILEKNGFEIVSARDDNAGTMEKYFYPRIGYVYRFSNGEWEVDLIGYGRGFSGAAKYRGVIKYVHELQHVFRILKLEKEIEL